MRGMYGFILAAAGIAFTAAGLSDFQIVGAAGSESISAGKRDGGDAGMKEKWEALRKNTGRQERISF